MESYSCDKTLNISHRMYLIQSQTSQNEIALSAFLVPTDHPGL